MNISYKKGHCLKLENRKEIKTIFNKNQYISLQKFLSQNCEKLFDERIVNSIYLDTKNLDVYKNNITNDSETSKYRFRYYEDEFNTIRYEKKINFLGKKTKFFDKNVKYKENFNSPYIIDNLYLFPISIVKFKRNYYSYSNIRLTIDENITFFKPLNKNIGFTKFKENKIIVEQKILNANDDSIEKNLVFPSEKYSKFLKSIETLYPNEIVV